ncbi:ABC transporter substrate-binding protein [Leucobacter sp. BZR 635]
MQRPKKLTKALLAGAALTALTLPLAACSTSPDTGGEGGALSQLSVVMRNDVDTFDPFKSAGEAGAKQVFDAVYDTLVRVDAADANVAVTGSLAEEWEMRENGGLFQLRDGLTCGDGTTLDAAGIAQSLEHLAAPETGALYASRVFGPGGLKAITADTEANTIDIELNESYTYLLEGLAQAYVVCPTAFDDLEALSSAPAETGTYTVNKMSRGESYELVSRDTPVFEQSKLPATLDLRVVTDDTTRANLLETSAVNISSVLGRDAERLKGSFDETDGHAFMSDALLFNQTEGLAVNDVEVRRAISLAVDNASYTKAATFDLGTPADTMYTPNMACYTEANGKLTTGFDVEAAKQTLKDAGYGEGGKPLKLRLLGIDTQNSGPEYIADALRTIGVEVEANKGTLEQGLGVLFGSGEWDLMVFPYPVPTPLPSALVNQISGELGETLNVGNVQNAEYNRLVAEAAATMGDERCALWGEAEAALLSNVDVKPMTWSNALWFSEGVQFSADFYKVDTRTIVAAK